MYKYRCAWIYIEISGCILYMYIYIFISCIYIYMDAVYLNDFDDVRGCFRRLGTRKVFFLEK